MIEEIASKLIPLNDGWLKLDKTKNKVVSILEQMLWSIINFFFSFSAALY